MNKKITNRKIFLKGLGIFFIKYISLKLLSRTINLFINTVNKKNNIILFKKSSKSVPLNNFQLKNLK